MLDGFSRKKMILFLSFFVGVVLIGILTLLVFSPGRFGLFEKVSGEIFNGPIIIALLRGEKVLSPLDIFNLILLNGVWVAGLILYNKKKGAFGKAEKIFLLSSVIICFIISSPFLWSEWAIRLYYIAYIFIIPILAMIFNSIELEKSKKTILGVVGVILVFSVAVTLSHKPLSNMDENCYKELKLIKSILPASGTTMIVARLGMHYWAGLILNTYVGQQSDARKEWWGRINHIYYLIQKSDIKPFGPAGLYGPAFPEPVLPQNHHLVFDGTIYRLYFIREAPDNLSE